jgi:hypothetical protein
LTNEKALPIDALRENHAVIPPVGSGEDIGQMFDPPVYKKVCSALQNALILSAAGLNGVGKAIYKAFHMFAQRFVKRKIPVYADLRRQVFAIVVKNDELAGADTLFFIILGLYDNNAV